MKIKPYKEALEIQNACNLIAIINSFQKVALAIHRHQRELQGNYLPNLRADPAIILFVDKIQSMLCNDTDTGDIDTMRAWDDCKSLDELELEVNL